MSAIRALAGTPNRLPDFVVLFERFQQIAVTPVTQSAMNRRYFRYLPRTPQQFREEKMTSDMLE
jgi:hypothetical protein